MQLELIQKDPRGMVLRFSAPAILSMLLTALVTVADGLFIGNFVGKEGIAALNLGLPFVYLFLGLGLMVSVGGAALAGMARGRGDLAECRRIFRQTAASSALLAALTALVVWLGLDALLGLFGAAGAEQPVRAACRAYYLIRLPELAVMVLNTTLGIFVRAEGAPGFALRASAAGTAANLLLDTAFVGWLGLGIAGAAWASVLAALISLFWYLCFFTRRAEVFRLRRFKFSCRLLLQSLANGSSELIGELSTGIAMFAYNLVILRQAGTDGVTAFTILGYTAYLFSMVTVGFGQGMSPLASFCYGAGQRALAGRLRRTAAAFVTGTGAVFFGLTALFALPYGRLFVQSESVLALVREGAGVFAVSFLLSGYNALASFYFTCTGRALPSAVISLARGLVVLLACILLLPAFFGMAGVWLAAPVTECITLALSVWFLRREARANGTGAAPLTGQDPAR